MRVVSYLRRDPGLALVLLALVLAALVYSPTLSRGLVNYDDHWLVRDNWIVQEITLSSLSTIAFDLFSPHRFVLTPEYLPIRDLSVMLDFAIWDDWFPGFHLTNLIVYLAATALWFNALVAFGVDRRVAGLTMLLWALQPAHAESVAWVSERKGLLAMAFAGACALSFAHFRSGRSARWLALGALCGVCAVWSKATGAFAVASLVGLELALPQRRVTWRRSLGGLCVIGGVTAAAFVPVLILARHASVVGSQVDMPGGRLQLVLGVHGFYAQLSAMLHRNAVSYPIATDGPTSVDIVLGTIGFAGLLVALLWRGSRPEVRAGSWIWLFGWLPIGHAVLPLQMVLVADRYMLFPTLGVALIVAPVVLRLRHSVLRNVLIAVVVLAAAIRSLDAQSSWASAESLWHRAVVSNPADGGAWAMYVEAIAARADDAGERARAEAIVEEGLRHSASPRLVLRQALLVLGRDRARGMQLMQHAAEQGEPIAMSNLALLLLDDRQVDAAMVWARRGAEMRPNVHAQRTLGKVALAAGHKDEALAAFKHAYALDPNDCANGVNLALGFIATAQQGSAAPLLARCTLDPQLGGRARAELARITPVERR